MKTTNKKMTMATARKLVKASSMEYPNTFHNKRQIAKAMGEHVSSLKKSNVSVRRLNSGKYGVYIGQTHTDTFKNKSEADRKAEAIRKQQRQSS